MYAFFFLFFFLNLVYVSGRIVMHCTWLQQVCPVLCHAIDLASRSKPCVVVVAIVLLLLGRHRRHRRSWVTLCGWRGTVKSKN